MILVLTGEKGAGKTTLLRKVISEKKIAAQGFLSLKVMDQGVVTGISLLVLPGNELVPMAVTTPMKTEVHTKRFYFNPGVFDRMNDRFRAIRPDLPFVFDEFGILERDGGGHYPVFRALLESSNPALIVVRRELTDDLVSRLGGACPYRVVEFTDRDPPGTMSVIAGFLLDPAGRRPL